VVLPTCRRPYDKNHFALEIVKNLFGQIAARTGMVEEHSRFLLVSKILTAIFDRALRSA
jgi:hypothetical protein